MGWKWTPFISKPVSGNVTTHASHQSLMVPLGYHFMGMLYNTPRKTYVNVITCCCTLGF